MPDQLHSMPDSLLVSRPLSVELTPVSSRDLAMINDDDRPPSPPSPIMRPPTPGGGPLSSHPATPEQIASRHAPPPPHPPQVSSQSGKADSVTNEPRSSFEKSLLEELQLKDPVPLELSPTLSNQKEFSKGGQAHGESLHHFLDQSRITPPLYDGAKPARHIDVAAAAATISPKPTSQLASVQESTAATPIRTNIPPRHPLTPASGNAASTSGVSRRNSTAVRKLLSFTSLRSSFSSSHVSLQQSESPTTSQKIEYYASAGSPSPRRYTPRQYSNTSSYKPGAILPPGSPSDGFQPAYTTTISGGPTRAASRFGRRSSPECAPFGLGIAYGSDRKQGLDATSTSGNASPSAASASSPLSKRKSGTNWMRRASGMLMFDDEDKARLRDAPQSAGGEEHGSGWRSGWGSPGGGGGGAAGNRSGGRRRQGNDRGPNGLPVLPELQGIGGGELDSWGDDALAGIKAAS